MSRLVWLLGFVTPVLLASCGGGGDGATCGDFIYQSGEECDGESYCNPDCTLSVCGNGVVEVEEACDDGNLLDGDACPSTCSVCGDGIRKSGHEICDDGNTLDGDDCGSKCDLPGGLRQQLVLAERPVDVAAGSSGLYIATERALVRVAADYQLVIVATWPADVIVTGITVDSVGHVNAIGGQGEYAWLGTFDDHGLLAQGEIGGGGAIVSFADIAAVPSGGVAIVGSYRESSAAVQQALLLDVGADGKELWRQVISDGDAGVDDLGLGVAVSKSGEIVLLGALDVAEGAYGRRLAASFDATGEPRRLWSAAGMAPGRLLSGAFTTSGELAIGGFIDQQNGAADRWSGRLDVNGALVWEDAASNAPADTFMSAVAAIGERTYFGGRKYGYLIESREDDLQMWSAESGYIDLSWPVGMTVAPGFGLVTVGSALSSTSNYDAYWMRVFTP